MSPTIRPSVSVIEDCQPLAEIEQGSNPLSNRCGGSHRLDDMHCTSLDKGGQQHEHLASGVEGRRKMKLCSRKRRSEGPDGREEENDLNLANKHIKVDKGAREEEDKRKVSKRRNGNTTV